jgi:hypothetical protein
VTPFVHDPYRVRGALEDRFEAHYRDGWMGALAEGDDARLVWCAQQVRQRHHRPGGPQALRSKGPTNSRILR